ncbi:TAXI family TRAP transporter solute-binding subunit [Dichotomicrobium thermohalophilum]|uniref:TRAP transporter TAXI family solute receptor n=1 Tax=Dichotomicrobium thermohalophilum TaxID=933063 RepID=A0A397Q9T9_9HYPH|nr:TAXI family TRAP transporter solute-binding subunit [Dichotomicrobium thermohalophilum]RIA55011.1 TRAP transporter TAXI family solute receptor [Dichotomicrobium thermohalophilum]
MMTCALRKVARLLAFSATLAISTWVMASGASAQDTGDQRLTPNEWRQQVNAGTVRIITKGAGCTCTELASDMAKVLNELGETRVLPILGVGSLQGMADVLYLEGIDMSIVQADALAYIKQNKLHQDVDGRIRYITKLHNSEVHLIARRDINSLAELDGKVVSFGEPGSGELITGRTILKLAGIEVEEVFRDRDKALEQLEDGQIDAMFIVTGKPADAVADLTKQQGLHLVPLEFTPELAQYYIPSEFTSTSYPNIIPEGEVVPTVAVGEVLAVYNWKPDTERYAKLERFVNAFFDKFEQFLAPSRHRKWKEVNLAAEVPGWQRFGPAERKLRQILAERRQQGGQNERQLFAAFVKSVAGENMSEQEIGELYRRFTEWVRQQ